MIDLHAITQRLSANADGFRVLLNHVTDQQSHWQPGPGAWSLLDVMTHMLNEERVDFRRHLKEWFHDPPLPWQVTRDADLLSPVILTGALDGFLAERADSLAWLGGLGPVDWDMASPAPWGEIRAGDVLVSWVAHDYLHLRQVNELLYAWNVRQGAPYSVQYAGEW